MKRILAYLLFLLPVSVFAEELEGEQLLLQGEITAFLKEVQMTEVEKDGTCIYFTRQGIRYGIDINANDDAPYYLRMWVTYNYDPKKYEAIGLLISIPEVLRYKGIKFAYADDYVVFSHDMFLHDASNFKYSFFKILEYFDLASQEFPTIYAESMKSLNESSISSTSSNANEMPTPSASGSDVIIKYPSIGNASPGLKLEEVILSKNYTKLTITSNGGQSEWCTISKNSYLVCNGIFYNLTNAVGIGISPDKTNYPKSGQIRFQLYFKPLPHDAQSIAFSEGVKDGWFISSISLQKKQSQTVSKITNGVYSFNVPTIETDFHSWELLSIEFKDEYTLVRKRVTPKDTYTYVESDGKEYILDVDTGNKYFLVSSSISTRKVLKDKAPFEFSEVYAAMPKSVKRISIWSGSQFYITNCTIR